MTLFSHWPVRRPCLKEDSTICGGGESRKVTEFPIKTRDWECRGDALIKHTRRCQPCSLFVLNLKPLNFQRSRFLEEFNSCRCVSGDTRHYQTRQLLMTHNTLAFCHLYSTLTLTCTHTLHQKAPTNRGLDWMKVDRGGRGFWVM